VPRSILAAVVLTAVCMPSMYQAFLDRIYASMYESSFYRFSGFETVLTIVSYSIIEPLYTYKFGHSPKLRLDVRGSTQDTKKPRPRLPKMRRPMERLGEMLVYVGPLLLLDAIMIKKFAGVPINDIRRTGNYEPVATSLEGHYDVHANISNQQDATGHVISPSFLLPTIHNFSFSSPMQLERALPPFPPTSRRLVLELITAFFIYDTVFFATHLAFHKIGPLVRLHNPHHTHAEIHPQVTNRLSIAERLSLVMLANFSLNIIGSHVVTRTLFVPLFVYLLIEIHSGMDLEWGYDKIIPSGWGAGARSHAQHHKTGTGAYAPFFAWWDAAFSWWQCRGQNPEPAMRSS
jgi:cholesterol 25-hydroxylase